jgi:hypothetical protein
MPRQHIIIIWLKEEAKTKIQSKEGYEMKE